MPDFAHLPRRTPNEHNGCLLPRLLGRTFERAEERPGHEERRRQVRPERPLPLPQAHLRERHVLRLVVRVIDHRDLHRTERRVGRSGGGEKPLDVILASEVCLEGADTVRAELLQERVERRRLGVVVGADPRTKFCVCAAAG